MEDKPMMVRCIYGGSVQRQAEAAGMKPWCDEHCNRNSPWIGIERGHQCPQELRKYGIRIYGQTW